ncbi:MAG: phosphate signaling complex protein PhoU [Phascolarctobacterium sp.]|nr:phosphate signaling complex protein PhoU [Phascolarctobacterium sp.]
MRNRFDEQLHLLNDNMIEMGEMCEEAINLATKSLVEFDAELEKKTNELENSIDHMEHSIEALCLKLLLQQQPVARDLRQISAALKMITDMERIGDQARDIVAIIPSLKGRTISECEIIKQMAAATMTMVNTSVLAYVKKDVSLAKNVIEYDDVVDRYFRQIKEVLINMIANNREDGEYALNILMIAKYFERIGDHATNIAEWVEFSVTGSHKSE